MRLTCMAFGEVVHQPVKYDLFLQGAAAAVLFSKSHCLPRGESAIVHMLAC